MSDDDEVVDAEEPGAEEEPDPIEKLTAERDKLKDQLLRTAADFDNYRKRSRKDVEAALRRGKEDVLRDLLPVFDNLERALDASGEAVDVAAVHDGVRMVLKLFEDTAQRMGLEKIAAIGERFDPTVHDAFQQQETDEHEPGTIVMEYQSGYRLGEKLIRPAMVVVARKPKPPENDASREAASDEEE